MKNFGLAVLTVTITAIVSLVVVEYVLLGMGHRPWTHSPLRENEPTMNERNSRLGWTNKPGRYIVPPYAAGEKSTLVTILANGSRATRNSPVSATTAKRGTMVLVGGSFTLGAAVSDDETFAWKLQQAFPEVDVLNFGTGGYGTFQSLLLLEDKIAEPPVPRAVLYGFIENHEQRNVASANWLENLARFSHRGHVSVPYATLEENRLTRQASEHYPAWPLRERFAVVASVEFAYARFIAKARTRQSVPVTRALLVEMHRLTRSRGIPFVVALLNFRADTRRRYMDFFRDQGIPYADCDFPLTRNEVVAGEWVHPTGRVHSYYADCIVATVKEILE